MTSLQEELARRKAELIKSFRAAVQPFIPEIERARHRKAQKEKFRAAAKKRVEVREKE